MTRVHVPEPGLRTPVVASPLIAFGAPLPTLSRAGPRPLRQRVSGVARDLRSRARALVRSDGGARARFVVFGRGRSGTALLIGLLNQHPEIHCDHEILNAWTPFPAAFLRRQARTAAAPVYGCKVLGSHIRVVNRVADPVGFLAGLSADGFRILHVRRNTFDSTLSSVRARLTGVYHLGHGATAEAGTHEIDPALFVEEYRYRQAMHDFGDAVAARLAHLEIAYETDLADAARHQATASAIFAYLGLPDHPVRAKMRKTGNAGAAGRIGNVAALRAAVAAAGFAETGEEAA